MPLLFIVGVQIIILSNCQINTKTDCHVN